ncbi:metallophosphoesterase [candidate division WOR-3 bacterium 4484_100]|uniref:Metallophosphoesterase n=1 Tax=candidate division WOR-3 bacterium 4484_100 TaxID=1936077 RepID=A0A1V4QF62_UNCW3|nr:MAG: metallophosphoesterase [candidate division WOR-3 bacterium 4484_100]
MRRILFIGDIIGSPGRKKICQYLPEIIKKENIFFTIAQGENLAGGIGITEKTARQLFNHGVDCITTGNHVWKYKDVYDYLNKETKILRPANYPEGVPGYGYFIFKKEESQIGVINLEGRVFMKPLEDPFKKGKEIIEKIREKTPNIIIDFHAEATAEKRGLALYLAEYTTAILGTHTHIQTADECIIDDRCAYITDVGMVGSRHSVIGDKKEEVIKHFLYSIPQKFKVAKEDIIANSVIIEFDENIGVAKSIIRYNF